MPWQTNSTHGGCACAVNASTIAVVVNGQNYTVPVDGFGASGSDSSSSGGRRLLTALSRLLGVPQPHKLKPSRRWDSGQGWQQHTASRLAHSSSQRRLQQNGQGTTDTFNIQLTITKCSDERPVDDAEVPAPCACGTMAQRACVSSSSSS